MLLQNQLELEPCRSGFGSARSDISMGGVVLRTRYDVTLTKYLTSQICNLPIGQIRMDLVQEERSWKSSRTALDGSKRSKLTFTFVPPRWISDDMIQYALTAYYNSRISLPSLTCCLTPVRINHDQRVQDAFHNGDVTAMKQLFAVGLVRPTDYIATKYDAEPQSLQKVFSESLTSPKHSY